MVSATDVSVWSSKDDLKVCELVKRLVKSSKGESEVSPCSQTNTILVKRDGSVLAAAGEDEI